MSIIIIIIMPFLFSKKLSGKLRSIYMYVTAKLPQALESCLAQVIAEPALTARSPILVVISSNYPQNAIMCVSYVLAEKIPYQMRHALRI